MRNKFFALAEVQTAMKPVNFSKFDHKMFSPSQGGSERRTPSPRIMSPGQQDLSVVLTICSPKNLTKIPTNWLPAGENPKLAALERSLSFKSWEAEEDKPEPTVVPSINISMDIGILEPVSFASPMRQGMPAQCLPVFTSPRPLTELNAAATRVQKVYKSYRTRRNLADCAVVVEELWWKALDFATLKHSSVSFFNVDKHETAASRWARARTRAAKVGKGLSKDEKAQKLALQHWLEAIDPRHRYGHNLHLYYDVWFGSESTEPFFFWLDVGAGKEVNLEKCPRCKLQQQLIKYLGPNEREDYEVIIINGKLVYRKSEDLVNTTQDSKWIFVLSTTRSLYVGKKQKGTFQHSSFLSGGATTAAGRLVAKEGMLQAIWPYSGHYLPTEENFKEFISFLEENHVDLSSVKRCSVDDDFVPSEDNTRVSALESMKMSNVGETGTTENVSEKAAKLQKESSGSFVTSSMGIKIPTELAARLSCSWTSGIGARIGCVRDYPQDLQSKALEQVNLSPQVGYSPLANRVPIPSPRPIPKLRLSPRLQFIGIPSPRPVVLTLPAIKSS